MAPVLVICCYTANRPIHVSCIESWTGYLALSQLDWNPTSGEVRAFRNTLGRACVQFSPALRLCPWVPCALERIFTHARLHYSSRLKGQAYATQPLSELH